MRFRAVIEQSGRTATGFEVPAAAAKRLETRRRRIDRAIEMPTEGRPTG